MLSIGTGRIIGFAITRTEVRQIERYQFQKGGVPLLLHTLGESRSWGITDSKVATGSVVDSSINKGDWESSHC